MEFGECVYCGEQRELTRDHVPPRCLFSKPRPSDLITVPCCAHCNGDFQKHDEYFRIAITTGIDLEKFPKENADSIRALKNLAQPALASPGVFLRTTNRNRLALRLTHSASESPFTGSCEEFSSITRIFEFQGPLVSNFAKLLTISKSTLRGERGSNGWVQT
jgi:hypothetical protein